MSLAARTNRDMNRNGLRELRKLLRRKLDRRRKAFSAAKDEMIRATKELEALDREMLARLNAGPRWSLTFTPG